MVVTQQKNQMCANRIEKVTDAQLIKKSLHFTEIRFSLTIHRLGSTKLDNKESNCLYLSLNIIRTIKTRITRWVDNVACMGCTGWSKSLCARDDYNTDIYKYCSKCPTPPSPQSLIDTSNCVLEHRVQYSTVHIPNVFCGGHLQLINCVGTVGQVHRDLLITLYEELRYTCLRFLRKESTWMIGVLTLNCPPTTQQLRAVDCISDQGVCYCKHRNKHSRSKASGRFLDILCAGARVNNTKMNLSLL
jgi:hypothetical protein